MIAFSKPGNECTISSWMSLGSDVENPCRYMVSNSSDSGSKNNRCLGLSLKRTSLSSIDGQ